MTKLYNTHHLIRAALLLLLIGESAFADGFWSQFKGPDDEMGLDVARGPEENIIYIQGGTAWR